MAAREHGTDSLAEMRRRTRLAFTDASFAPYGLDERWEGTRWFGGSGHSNGEVTRLELAHGNDPWDEESQLFRVEVRVARHLGRDGVANVEHERAFLAGEQVSRYWMATGTLDPVVRAAAFPTGETQGEPTAPWADAELTIDTATVMFSRLGNDGYWLAQAIHQERVVGIEARAWPVASAGLVTVRDLAPYIDGSEVIAARGRSRFA